MNDADEFGDGLRQGTGQEATDGPGGGRTKPPAKRPCGSCPYRRDVPSGVWHSDEYAKLPTYDGETFDQPPGVFHCHQQDGRVCAGWVGCHDMDNNLGLRMATMTGSIDPETADAILDYESEVPLFSSGAEAAEHGMRDVETPDEKARRLIDDLTRKRAVRDRNQGGAA